MGYMAPELVAMVDSRDRATQSTISARATDMWGLGEITYRMVTGKPTFDGIMALLQWSHAPTCQFLKPLQQLAPDVVIDFIEGLMKAEPSQRLSTKQAVNHPWLKSRLKPLCADSDPLPSTEHQTWPHYPPTAATAEVDEPSAKWSTLSPSTILQRETLQVGTTRNQGTAKANSQIDLTGTSGLAMSNTMNNSVLQPSLKIDGQPNTATRPLSATTSKVTGSTGLDNMKDLSEMVPENDILENVNLMPSHYTGYQRPSNGSFFGPESTFPESSNAQGAPVRGWCIRCFKMASTEFMRSGDQWYALMLLDFLFPSAYNSVALIAICL